ncbi:MAG: efflux RND transporter periplasmic adaptor subunit [Deltaproteobacteria bacterium]|nr:efflux RND transporter periplasmic adaptor subunit [Deltaproteobacteria bacterium]
MKMPVKIKFARLLGGIAFVLAALLVMPAGPKAHEGHTAAPGGESASLAEGLVRISPEARKNLDLRTEAAELRPIEKVLTTVGRIAPIPERSGAVSSRISGRVVDLMSHEGAKVERGQPMVRVESRQLGSPPPSVTYRAPLSGVVTDRHVVVGDSVEPATHLFELADLREVYAVAKVFEGQIGQVRQGAKARVRVDGYSDEVFEGSIERTAGELDRTSGSLDVYVRLVNEKERLLPGMTASVAIVIAESDVAVTIPEAAVLGDSGRNFAFVQGEDPLSFERRELVLGLADDRYQEVIEGILPGDEVVVRGNYQLQYIPGSPASKNDEHEEQTGTKALDKVDVDHEASAGQEPASGSTPGPGQARWVWAAGAVGILAILWLGVRARRARHSSVREA